MLYPQRLTQFTKEHADTLAALFCGFLLFLGWLALYLDALGLALLLLPAAYVIGGYESAREGLTTLFKEKELDVDLLMIVAALGAAGLGLWRREYHLIVDGAILILIFAVSGVLEGYAMQRTEKSIRSLMSLTPDTAMVLRQGREEMLAIRELQIGDEIVVKPGELIPTDGVIVSGYSTINQAAITGESLPVEKTVGAEVFAGTINGYGALRLKVHKPAASSLIQRVIRLVEQAQTEAPPSQQFIERFERGYARVIVVAGIMLATLPPFLWGWDWETTIYRALTFLVVASPCALMAAIMPTLLSGIANGARQGILFKNGAQLEKMGKVRAIAFDKTGTLTTGQVEVCQVIAHSKYSVFEVLKAAASLEASSEHPIGKAIVQAATDVDWVHGVEVQAIPGKGIVGIAEDQKVIVGNAAFVQEYAGELPAALQELAQSLEMEGKTVVWVAAERCVDKTYILKSKTLHIYGVNASRRGAKAQRKLHKIVASSSSALHIYGVNASRIRVASRREGAKTQRKLHKIVAPLSPAFYQIMGIIAIADTVRSEAVAMIKRLRQMGVEEIVMITGDNQRTADK
jgi:Cd2+/Zn2+-exporting ATPase